MKYNNYNPYAVNKSRPGIASAGNPGPRGAAEKPICGVILRLISVTHPMYASLTSAFVYLLPHKAGLAGTPLASVALGHVLQF